MRTYFPGWWIVAEWSPITQDATGDCLYHAPQRPTAEALMVIARHVQNWRGTALVIQNSRIAHRLVVTVDEILNPATPTPDAASALVLARTRPSIPPPCDTDAHDTH